jgi:hypothetical protein
MMENTQLKVRVEQPPNIDLLRKHFPIVRGVLFVYDKTIYNPDGVVIPPALMMHERVHVEQQSVIPADDWWARYIENERFRLDQEFEAFEVEYLYRLGEARNRHERRMVLIQTAARLASPLYGKMLRRRNAANALKRGYLYEQIQRDPPAVREVQQQ